MALHTISLASGILGLDRGLDIAAPGAFKPVLYCERGISASAIIAKEIKEGRVPAAPIWSDVKTLCGGSCSRYLHRVGVDAIIGGYPCQPFSAAGQRRGSEDPRHLWPWIIRSVEEYRPSIAFFENVAGHLRLGYGEVRRDLREAGYRVAEGLFAAAEVGASHRRERLFILAVADSSIEGRQGQTAIGAERPNNGNAGRGGGTDVDHPAIQRPQGDSGRGVQWEQPMPASLPSYPPGPSDRDAWERILAEYPGLAPAVTTEETQPNFRGVADGLSRADELRAYGNAVVPECAAVAFISLWANLTKSQ